MDRDQKQQIKLAALAARKPNTQPSKAAMEAAQELYPGSTEMFHERMAKCIDRHMAPERQAAEKMRSALAGLLAAIDNPRYGDDSIWDDLNGFFVGESPLDKAREALAAYEEAKHAK